jgi:hypothetical protein
MAALGDLRSRDLIALEEGTWRLEAPLKDIDFEMPESLQQMIELQIDRLSATEQRLLEIASNPKKFPLSITMAAAVANAEPDSMEELFEKLARRHQIIRRAGFINYRSGHSPCYEIVHVLYRQVVYRRIGLARRPATSPEPWARVPRPWPKRASGIDEVLQKLPRLYMT